MYKIILLFLISFSVSAETINATPTYSVGGMYVTDTASATCDLLMTARGWGAHSVGGPPNYQCKTNDFLHFEYVIKNYWCPVSGVLSGTTCINATPCVAPAIRSNVEPTVGQCIAPAVACPAGQYTDLLGHCAPIPNCNADLAVDGNYFDVNTKMCVLSTDVVLCIASHKAGEPRGYFCPPTNDCQFPDDVCSNDPAVIADAAANRAAEVAAAKAAADISKANAAAAAAQAAASSTAKDAQKAAALAAKDAAKIASDATSLNPASTASQIAAAAESFAKAASDYVAAAAKAANSGLAKLAAQTAAGDAIAHNSAITGQNPGNAKTLEAYTYDDAFRAGVAAADSLSGLGSGTGTGMGASAGTCTETGTCTNDLAKDATLQNIGFDVKGIKDGLSTKVLGTATPSGARTFGASNQALIDSFHSKFPAVVFSDDVPECPVFSADIPFLNFTMVIDQYCSLDSVIRPVLGAAALAAYSLAALFIVMGA